MLLRTKGKAIVGAFIASELAVNPHNAHAYTGTGESFLFECRQTDLVLYGSTDANPFYVWTGEEGFGLGGDPGFGLWVDESLRTGRSRGCRTYGNDVLGGQPEFEITALEIWGFASG